MYVNGASSIKHPGAGIYLKGPHKMETNLRVMFQFPVRNNVAEYEALITRLTMAIKADLWRISIHNDSQLVVDKPLNKQTAETQHWQNKKVSYTNCNNSSRLYRSTKSRGIKHES